MKKDIVKMGYDCGFSHAAPVDIATLTPMDAVRDMCRADKCTKFNTCWSCPPGCGTIEECGQKIRRYETGVLLQTTGRLADSFDAEGMESLAKKHAALMKEAADRFRKEFDDCLVLSAGACTVCDSCTYPDAPCRFPERSFSSMEAYGLWVSKVCEDNGLSYYYGENTLTYSGCILIRRS